MKIYKICGYVLLWLVSLTGAQCRSARNLSSQKKVDKSIYVNQFKLAYVRQVLVKAYNNSDCIQHMIKFDKSGFHEPVLTRADDELIDSLTTQDETKMELDSANSIGRVAEGAEGKHPLGFILDKLESKWLDSLAEKRYRISGFKIRYDE